MGAQKNIFLTVIIEKIVVIPFLKFKSFFLGGYKRNFFSLTFNSFFTPFLSFKLTKKIWNCLHFGFPWKSIKLLSFRKRPRRFFLPCSISSNTFLFVHTPLIASDIISLDEIIWKIAQWAVNSIILFYWPTFHSLSIHSPSSSSCSCILIQKYRNAASR